MDNQSGRDVVYRQAGEDSETLGRGARNRNEEVGMADAPGAPAPGHSITVSGTPEFRQRVEADLDLLRASPDGRQMLAALDQAAAAPPAGRGHKVTISEKTFEYNGAAGQPGTSPFGVIDTQTQLSKDHAGNIVPAVGDHAQVRYNPSFHSAELPVPSVTLFHELSHAYGIVTGTMQPGKFTGGGDDKGVNNFERQASGLGNTGLKYDFDNHPSTPATRDYPEALTENGLRDEMGLRRRDQYRGGRTDAVGEGAAARATLEDTGDAHVHAMVRAMEAKDPQAMRQALQALAGSPDGAAFRAQGAQAFEQQAQRQGAATQAATPYQDAPPAQADPARNAPVQSEPAPAGGMRR